MPNRLADQTSPYLRQHADNPVDWWPWGDEAFALARETDRPVLLSVGYSSCHWCHVMAHESFEDPAVAALVNDWFVPIKVDREERPDVDAVYMEATQAMTGHGGWPMTVFADPDGRPFFCGTYFPPDPRHGQPAFTQVLQAVHEAWAGRRDELLEQAERLTESLRRGVGVPPEGASPGTAELDEATMGLLAAFDADWGGFGRAPKFPQTMSLDHLLRQHARSGSAAAIGAVVTSLDAMAAGGIHDHLGGGFSRYSVDRQWLVPHFEKMLYDNALLLRVYAHAAQVTGEQRFADVAAAIVDYVLRDLSHPDGGRYSAEDADSLPSAGSDHAEEGAFYVWTPTQVAEALDAAGLGERTEATLEWYGITAGGNFEGASIPNRLHARGDLARPDEIEAARIALLAARSERPRPGLDDKVLTEWNALFVAALAEAGAALGRADWVAEAVRTAEFLCRELRAGAEGAPEDGAGPGRWLRSWQAGGRDGSLEDGGEAGAGTDGAGRARHLAYAADHGALLDAFLSLSEATGERRWLDEAVAVADALDTLFVDDDGTVWSTGTDAPDLLVRPREVMDNATPSGASLAATGFLRLGALTGDPRWSERGAAILRALGAVVARHPLGFGNLLWALQMEAYGLTELVISGDRPDLVAVAHRAFRPITVLSWGEPLDGPLWEGRHDSGADGRAYVCRDHTCEAPISDPAALADALRAPR
ncbi:thioredoxin domain-containing protein [Dermatobacter hominis]|uniref:thioredoxin domain-containing protein n=1 Tax=Dermatobacter hominis TaxID=2884263 RepID=UPI001D110D47|nr:thioredoxin domain-containing protein [Dermatobacter hominis]UDY35996.1 thioredoxin domain-containing protein [Dermatobacter hominis]